MERRLNNHENRDHNQIIFLGSRITPFDLVNMVNGRAEQLDDKGNEFKIYDQDNYPIFVISGSGNEIEQCIVLKYQANLNKRYLKDFEITHCAIIDRGEGIIDILEPIIYHYRNDQELYISGLEYKWMTIDTKGKNISQRSVLLHKSGESAIIKELDHVLLKAAQILSSIH